MCRRALVRLLVLLFMAQVLPLAATPYQFRGLDGDQLTDLAENLLSQDRLGEAAQILEQLELEEAGGTRRAFLQGLLAEAQGQYFIAADRFSAILGQGGILLPRDEPQYPRLQPASALAL